METLCTSSKCGIGGILPQNFFLRFGLTIDFSISNRYSYSQTLGGGGPGPWGDPSFPPHPG